MGAHVPGIVYVPCIEDYGPLQERFHVLDVRALEHVPLGDDGQAVSALEGFVGIVDVRDAVPEDIPRVIHALGVIRPYLYPMAGEGIDDVNGGRLPHVIGLGFESESPDRHGEPGRVFTLEMVEYPLGHVLLLPPVRPPRGLADLQRVVVAPGRGDERLNVLGEAGAAEARSCQQEARSDALVRSHAFPHQVDVGAQLVAQNGQLVHEGDLGGQEAVGGVLGELGTGDVHDDDRVVRCPDKGAVELLEQLGGADVVCAHDDPVGTHEILDGVALLEKLRVGHHVELEMVQAAGVKPLPHGVAHHLRGAHGHGGLVHDDLVLVHDVTEL